MNVVLNDFLFVFFLSNVVNDRLRSFVINGNFFVVVFGINGGSIRIVKDR